MTGALGFFFLLIPLAAPLIAQNSIKITDKPPVAKACAYYNETCARTKEGCPEYMTCSPNDEKDNLVSCFVSWRNSTEDGVVVTIKGCAYYATNCNPDLCISHQERENWPPHRNLACCCFKDRCNEEFFWQPKEPSKVKTPDTPLTPGYKETNVVLVVLTTLGGLIAVFILMPLMFYYYRKQKLSSFHEIPTSEATALTPSICTSLRPIQLVEVKARGRFGAVWKAMMGKEVLAVKIFPVQDKQSWMSEKAIYSLPHMSHENILQFVGAETRVDGFNMEYWLITSYHELGSLYDYLKQHTLTWSDLLTIGHSLSLGLAFLHSETTTKQDSKPAIAHRDFKSKNVLLKSNLTACIADFGLALAFYPGQSMGETHGQVGTRRYMSPEVLEGAITFHRDAFLPIDMYACALVLWEICTRCSALSPSPGEYQLPFEKEVGLHPTLESMQECACTQRGRPEMKETWLKHEGMDLLMRTIRETWDHDAEARLSASCIMERFGLLRKNLALENL